MSGYTVEWERGALKQLDGIQARDRARILNRVTALADDPRPAGVVKLAGTADVWRIRVGDYRVIYTVADHVLVVTVVDVGHRREVYRGL